MDYEGRFMFSESFENIALLCSDLFVADGRSGASNSHSFVCCFFFSYDTPSRNDLSLNFFSSIINVS